MSSGQGAAFGLTLIELLIVLVILVITITLAASPMRNLVSSTRVSSEVNRLMTAVNLTRSEALKRNQPVSMCPSVMSTSGDVMCTGYFSDGWIIFSNVDKDNVVDEEDEIIQIFEGIPSGYTLSNRKGTIQASEKITYLSDGSSRRNRTLLLCAPIPGGHISKSLIINIVGRPRISSNWGACPPS
ncbi:MAG: GspH/FimT family protein [Halieaceae bacterium]